MAPERSKAPKSTSLKVESTKAKAAKKGALSKGKKNKAVSSSDSSKGQTITIQYVLSWGLPLYYFKIS